jgi:hypothetical protein
LSNLLQTPKNSLAELFFGVVFSYLLLFIVLYFVPFDFGSFPNAKPFLVWPNYCASNWNAQYRLELFCNAK